MSLRKLFLSSILFTFLFFSSTASSNASNFSTKYNIDYVISKIGLAKASFNITLTNQTEKYYTSSYKITTGFKDAKNVRASDKSGILESKTEDSLDGVVIEVLFDNQVVGLGEKRNFAIYFDSNEVAKKQGLIWEVNVPGFENIGEIEDVNIGITVPQSFGNVSMVKNKSREYKENFPRYSFSKKDIGKAGVILFFGNTQTYTFNLTYHLKNDNVFPIKTEIALPPSTNYQKVLIDSIKPRPLNVKIDDDGNWLAQFNLIPSQKIDINVKGNAQVFKDPEKEILSKKNFKKYTEPKKYWESNSQIKKLAEDYPTPIEIYKYVTQTLNYDFSRVTESKPRLGSLKIIENPYSAVCLEFTDLFIAIARAAGIPAREVDGFAYAENKRLRPLSLGKDILHAWPEYYDANSQTWVMVDPTWENTTGGVDYYYNLDFNHLAFVRKGIESDYPIPAGGYKLKGQEKIKDVDVEFSNSLGREVKDISIKPVFSNSFFPGFPIKGKILIKNEGNSQSLKKTVQISSNYLTPSNQVIKIENIPPFGYIEKYIFFDKTTSLTNKKVDITIQTDSQKIVETVRISFFPSEKYVIIGGVPGIVTIIGLLLIIKKRKHKISG